MIGSINGWELIVLIAVVVIVVGPERLPDYAAQLGRVIREIRTIARGATARVKDELGDDFEQFRDLDPRQYDPRRIIREALADDDGAPTTALRTSTAAGPGGPGAASTRPAQPAPFDDEAT